MKLINKLIVRVFIALIFLTFGLHSSTNADDISEFQIEGMSIGDSLLDYMSETEINSNKRNYVDGKRYYVVAYFKSLNLYDNVDIYLKRKDKNYTIRTVTGQLRVKGQKCLSKKKEIEDSITKMFPNKKLVSYENAKHTFDKSGKSLQSQSAILLKNHNDKDHIRIECTFWSDEIKNKYNFEDHLNVAAMTTEILNWFIDGYN